jgi:preprotein translocase subunit SecE
MAKSATAQITDESGVGGKLKAWPQRTKAFLSDVRNEMRHVSKPSRKEVVATTTVVLITVALFGVYFFAVDLVIGRGIDELFRYFTH